MIKLENIGVAEIVKRVIYLGDYFGNDPLYYFDNVQEIKDAISKDETLAKKVKFSKKELGDILKEIEKQMEVANTKGKEPTIYPINRHDNNFPLALNDYYVVGDVLITNPTLPYSPLSASLKWINIYNIKWLLSHTDANGNNLFSEIMDGIGPSRIKKILPLITFYDEQVMRQYQELDNIHTLMHTFNQTPIFYLNKTAKQAIVEEEINDIIMYLLDNTKEELIWGKLSDNQKKLLETATRNKNITREHLIQIITNYTTLSELEKGITKTKTLNRFIRK